MIPRFILLASRRAISYQRDKHWMIAGAVFASSFIVDSTLLHMATGGVLAYNGLDRIGVIQYDRTKDIPAKNSKLMDLLRYQLETTESFHEYVQPQTLLIAMPSVAYSDSGFIGLAKDYLKLPIKPEDKKFWMKCLFKDPRYEGEGYLECEGYFNSHENYYFRKIVAHFLFPVKKSLIVFDSEIINI